MNNPANTFVGTAHRSAIRTLRNIAVDAYAESLFDLQTIAWLKAESWHYALDESTENSIRFARSLALFRFARRAYVQGL